MNFPGCCTAFQSVPASSRKESSCEGISLHPGLMPVIYRPGGPLGSPLRQPPPSCAGLQSWKRDIHHQPRFRLQWVWLLLGGTPGKRVQAPRTGEGIGQVQRERGLILGWANEEAFVHCNHENLGSHKSDGGRILRVLLKLLKK